MTDEQRDQVARMCDPINRDVDENKLETDFEVVSHQLNGYIRLRRIEPENLPQYKVQKVVMDYNCMTIITDTGHYVHVSAEPGYHNSIDFSATGLLDIEDAHNLGILSQEQYDEYKKARQAYLEQRRKIEARTRLTNFVCEAGAANVQEYLDELNQ